MAITSTTLAADYAADTLTMNVTSAAGATKNGFVRVDAEFAVITGINGNKIDVRSRGEHGGTAVGHDVGAPVTFFVGADMPALGAGEQLPAPSDNKDIVSIGENGNFPAPKRDTLYVITKATALGSNSTLPNPSKLQDGLEVTLTSTTAAAHVVKLVTANDGTTGGNKTTLTFAAFPGATATLVAQGGAWAQKGNSNNVAMS